MKLKIALAAMALATSALTTTAQAAELIQGTGFWGAGTPTTAYSSAGSSFQFSFVVPNPLDDNPTTSISSFSYSLGGTLVAAAPVDIEFFGTDAGGLFDIAFADHAVSLYGADIASSGTFAAPGGYSFTSQIDGGDIPETTGLGFVTLSNVAAVPEPASWAMMIGGFGLVGGAIRARRRMTARVAYA